MTEERVLASSDAVDPRDSGAAASLRSAASEVRSAEAAVADYGGREQLERVAEALRSVDQLFSQYEERATGTGDFEAYVRFQEEVATLVEGLDDDVPKREAFEDALEAVEKRRLSESDFRAARRALEPARDLSEVRERLREARETFEDAWRRATGRLSDVEEAIAARERLLELGNADLDAPVEELREPIEAYDDAVTTAFATFRREASAREVLEVLSAASSYPLVDVRAPPDDLQAYVCEHDAGDETIPDLLAYAEYSHSKLDHYVDDPNALQAAVGTRRTYLDRLDGSGFAIGWPPPEAGTLKFRTRELLSVLTRFAGEETSVLLQSVRELAWRDDYDRLRTAAVALDELGPTEREKLASGAVAEELEGLRSEREAIEDALDDTDELP